ncbi:thioesterase domain protein [Aspergillus ellipticus CBS 707.79]|uniref:Thioesterase domain protein n=1 Tax=Aspergillus ellipticus CBS 707.79 TaxID=1448320 RepID=A0A319DHJ2_9EURO|nr:thioesterase domain protein [Aspergillus ellipticus CBS 707.79]
MRHHHLDLSDKANRLWEKDVLAYPATNPDKDSCSRLSYAELDELATLNSRLLHQLQHLSSQRIILLHFDDHVDNIIWLWSAVYAGFTPAMSTPFPRSPGHCIKHMDHLNKLLHHPICLTREALREQFPETTPFRIVEVECLQAHSKPAAVLETDETDVTLGAPSPALLMLTSGSTGACKAVSLTTQQIMAPDCSFLNWIRLDHVGSLIEIHLHALYLGCTQFYVRTDEIISHPLKFLQLIQDNRVARTFAPNFFLAELARSLESLEAVNLDIDISSNLLGRHGASENVIVPGFGMTETCAGCIYHLDCPRYEIGKSYEFASVGTCMPGDTTRASPREVGNLDVRGPIVFDSHYNDPAATAHAFWPGGWFRTGDTGFIDGTGKLNLSGRPKDILEAALEEAEIPGISLGYTEQVCVVYQNSYYPDDFVARSRVLAAIARRIMLMTNGNPHILPLPAVERTTLGKISRSQLRADLESGKLHAEQVRHDEQIRLYQQHIFKAPETLPEKIIMEEVAGVLKGPTGTMGVESDLFEIGMTSIGLVQLHHRLQERLSLDNKFSIATCMTHHNIRGLAQACYRYQEYNPVVTLRLHGSKTPLWLVHPAAGEALVFVNLAKLIPDRPVYAFRARGFAEGEPFFTSIEECIHIYHTAMKKLQRRGPYAILGYSYGGMLAFELAKVLEADGETVQFVASLNRPPYVSPRLRQVTWTECLVSTSYFLGLLSRKSFRELLREMRDIPKTEAIVRLIDRVDQSRLIALGLNEKKLEQWINVAFSLQEMGRSYEPTGSVAHMDVFHCDPLEFLGVSREEWLKRLSAWQDVSREETKYFAVQGEHATALGPQNVQAFYKTLRHQALAVRGL